MVFKAEYKYWLMHYFYHSIGVYIIKSYKYRVILTIGRMLK